MPSYSYPTGTASGWAEQLDTGTGLMDRIEKRGFAKRSAVPGDRRPVQVTLTAAGRRAASAFHSDMGDALARLIDPIPADDREQFRSTVEGIVMRCRTSPSSE
ncbi:MarR family winged helix-turn-helix transcriptional regulator [Kribbella sp. NPDC004536]|uniref:MarR family winged helix-turn-helix transcriptional regulator n=1 Tax=Kribbella sp. NPDC004536 TaxID=3364106 RepID=UPI0036B841A0